MSFMGSNVVRSGSPLPQEPDIGLCIRFTVPNEYELRFVACMSAALRFAVHCASEYSAIAVAFERPHPQIRRLPCEPLWTLP